MASVTEPVEGRPGEFAYDVALSFAGEQRGYVERVAKALRSQGVRPFYDDYERVNLWGKDLYEHLDWIYQKAARYCVLFASADYARKVWTTHERRSAQARALQSYEEYVLPVRFDDTDIPGLRSTVGFIDLRSLSATKLADLIVEKLGPRVRHKFFPPEPDLLYSVFGAGSAEDQGAIEAVAHSFMQTLVRMTTEERRLVAHILAEGCRTQLPDNVHISLDIVRRDLGFTPSDVLERLTGMGSLGFDVEVRDDPDHGADDVLVVRWVDTVAYDDEFKVDFADARATEIAVRMLDVGSGDEGCSQCARNCVDSLDFSLLASSTSPR